MSRSSTHHRATDHNGNVLPFTPNSYGAGVVIPHGGTGVGHVTAPPIGTQTGLQQQKHQQKNRTRPPMSQIWFDRVPPILRFGISGTLGNFIFFAIDRTFYSLVMSKIPEIASSGSITDVGLMQDAETGIGTESPNFFSEAVMAFLYNYRISISFAVAYLIQIFFQHVINAALVFGWSTINSRKKYAKGLAACYTAYATTCVGTTLLNAFLIKLDVPRGIAFWGTLYGFGVVNFFLLRQLMKSDSDDSTGSTDGDDALKNVKNGGSICLSRYRRPFLFFGNHKLLQVVKTTGRRVDV